MKGKLFGIDGLNGAGKSLLIKGLKKEFPDALFVREPGETQLGDQIRNILINRSAQITPLAEFLLFSADHNQTFETLVKPAIDSGRHVFTDRTWVSSLAFQGNLGVSLELIGLLSDLQTHYNEIIILDVTVEESIKRMSRRNLDSIESRPRDYQEKVRQSYLTFGDSVIDTMQKTPQEVLKEALKIIYNHA